MANFTLLFTQVVEGDFSSGQFITVGSGVLPPYSTLILHCGRTDNDTTSQSGIGDITVAGNATGSGTSTSGINSNISVAIRSKYYRNESGSSVDLTNAIAVEAINSDIGVVGQSVLIVQAFVADALMLRGSSTAAVFSGSGINASELTPVAGEYPLGFCVIPSDPATGGYTVTGTTGPTTYYAKQGLAPNAGGANLGITLQSMDWFGVSPGIACSIDGTLAPSGIDNGAAGFVEWIEEVISIETMPAGEVTFRLKARPQASVLAKVSSPLVQRYELGLLSSVSLQTYSYVIGKESIQPCSSLQSISQSSLVSFYSLGLTEVSAELNQAYGLSVSASLVQGYDSLTPVFSDNVQRYDSTVTVSTELTASYDLSNVNKVGKSLVSHYSSYAFSNVIVITSPPGLTYKPGYTIEPDS